MYEVLEHYQGEVGYLVTASGAGMERGRMGLLEPGRNTYITKGRASEGAPSQSVCAWCGQKVRKLWKRQRWLFKQQPVDAPLELEPRASGEADCLLWM